jgi:predicted MFS family arabinose efflux permease
VPAGLELARLGGWRAPFFIVAALGIVVTVAVMAMLPPQRAHLSAAYLTAPAPFRDVLRRPMVQLALAGPALAAMANAALYPNIWAYFQFNRGYPRDQLGLLYLVGGTITFFTARIAGRLTDRHGSPPVTAGGAAAYTAVLVCGFVYPVDVIPVLAIYVAYAISQGFRMLPLDALSSRVPEPHERARFMSALGSAECLAQTAGALIGVQLLTQHPDGSLAGIEHIGWLAIALALVHVAICYALDRRVCAPPDLPRPCDNTDRNCPVAKAQ